MIRQISWTVFLASLLLSNYPAIRAAEPYLAILGIAQDAGYPQAGCAKDCCKGVWRDPSARRYASCVAVIDPDSGQRWMFDCTPDFRDQLRLLDQLAPSSGPDIIDGVLPTHAHIGHYAGLIHLGREVIGAKSVPVYAMPRMKFFLESNGPWSQLVKLNQISVERLGAGRETHLNERISIVPFLVPHRDEFSETVGFEIRGPNRSIAYLPDIDKWERWDVQIESIIRKVDVALLDGTFYDSSELPGRNMSEIPHPFIVESVQRFSELPSEERAKIRFIHLNHSNELLRDANLIESLRKSGLAVAQQVKVNTKKATSATNGSDTPATIPGIHSL